MRDRTLRHEPLALTAALLTGLWLGSCAPAEVSDVLRQMASASGRVIEPRLTGGFAYGLCENPTRGRCRAAPEVGSPDYASLKRIEVDVRRLLRGRRQSDVLHLRAIHDLVWAQGQEAIVEADRTLNAALAHTPSDAQLLSDLAAVRYVRALEQDSPWHLVTALEAVEQALVFQPNLPEARFNLALVLDGLHLPGESRRAWERYLELDAVSGWAEEARQRLARRPSTSRWERWNRLRPELTAAALQGDLEALRAWASEYPVEMHLEVRDRMLPSWAAARVEGVSAAAPSSETLRHLTRILDQLTGDPLLAETMANLADVTRVARGLQAYAQGMDRYDAHCYGEARRHFRQAYDLLTEAASPFAGWAAFFDAVCAFQSSARDGARALRALAADSRFDRYPILRGRTSWVLGTSLGFDNRLDEALEHYATARRLLGGALGEPGTAFLHLLDGEALGLQGKREAAWKARHRAFVGLSQAGDPKRWHSALRSVGRSLERDGLPHAALRFFEEAVANAEAWGDPYALAASYQSRGRIRASIGHDGALEDFVRAESEAAALSCDARFQAGTLADLQWARAFSKAREAPEEALADLDAACRTYAEQRDHVHLARALALRGASRRALGDVDGAAADLQAAIDLFTEQLADQHGTLEPRFVADAEAAFRDLVESELDRGDARAALRAAERSRIVTPFGPSAQEPADGWLDRRLADRTVLVFKDLDDELILWRWDGEGLESFRLPVTPEQVRARVERTLDLVVSGDAAARAALSELYDLLVSEALAGARTHLLVVVPDRSLAAVPFAALRSAGGEYLVERFAITVAPNLAMLSANPGETGDFETALVIGDPAARSEAMESVPALPSAREEARRVAALYPDSTLLLGEEATRQEFLESWWRHSVVHVAAHSTLDVWTPYWWRLHLAPGLETTGDLEPDDLSGAGGPFETRLVVLSSCSSALDGSSLARAPFGIAGSFLSAGVPAVVGALWPVDDEATARLMDEFHRNLTGGHELARALRRAQLSLLASEADGLREPRAWAAFRLIGSSG